MNSETTKENENVAVKVNSKLMIMIVVVIGIIGYVSGYMVSSKTGVEPGFFEIAESGGYGAGTESKPVEGMSDDLQDYYNKLADDN